MITRITELIKKKPSLKKKYKKIIQNHPNIFSTYKTWGLASKDWKTTVPKLIDKVYDQLINHEYNVTYKRLQQLRKNGDILASILENDIREYNEKTFGRATKKKKKATKKKSTIKKTKKNPTSKFYVPWSSYFDAPPYYQKEKIARIVRKAGGKNVHYENAFGWSNQPEVVVFSCSGFLLKLDEIENSLQKGLKTEWVRIEPHWGATKKNPKKFWYKVNRPRGQGRHIMNPPLKPKTKETIYGWGKRKPTLQSERRTVAKEYGRGCFLDKRGLRFPVCGKTGHIDCDGLKSAYARARQFGHKAWADRALRLAKKYECDWVQRHRNPSGKEKLLKILRVGDRVKVAKCSGVESGKEAVVVSRNEIKTSGRGIPTNVEGAYRPVDWTKEVAIKYLDSNEYDTMYKNRLIKIPQRHRNPMEMREKIVRLRGKKWRLPEVLPFEGNRPDNFVYYFYEAVDYRHPKKGEYFVSGAPPEAYLSPNDLNWDFLVVKKTHKAKKSTRWVQNPIRRSTMDRGVGRIGRGPTRR